MKKYRLIFTFLSGFLVLGCQIPYLLKNSWHQTKILKSRTPIEKILDDPKASLLVKQKLQLVQQARKFAISSLGLTKSENYTSFVDLKRDYVTWIVRAAPKYKLEPYKWWFPITGHVPYKGYFSIEGAKNEAQDLKNEGYDTFVRGVTAYSTLGWFEDPVLNTMLSYDDYDLVNLIIHETVHATVFIKSQVDFNERLATFVGNKGAEKFFESRPGGKEILLQAQRENQDLKIFSTFITKELEDLKKWYDSEKQDVVLQNREEKFESLRRRFQTDVIPKLKTNRFHYFQNVELNNAVLLSYESYQSNLQLFESLYLKLNSDFKALIKHCKQLQKSEDPEEALKKLLSG